jgi:hypothetical protein
LPGPHTSFRGEARAQLLPARREFARVDRTLLPGRPARVDAAALERRARIYHRSPLDHRARLDHAAVEDHGVVLDDAAVAHLAGMDHGVAADGDAVADHGGVDIVRDVDRGAVAEREIVTGAHVVAVRADHARRAEPRVAAQGDTADDRGIGADMPRRAREFGMGAEVGQQVRMRCWRHLW